VANPSLFPYFTRLAAGEMLAQAEPFLEKNIHPTVIVSAYKKALAAAIKVCETIALPVNVQDK